MKVKPAAFALRIHQATCSCISMTLASAFQYKALTAQSSLWHGIATLHIRWEHWSSGRVKRNEALRVGDLKSQILLAIRNMFPNNIDTQACLLDPFCKRGTPSQSHRRESFGFHTYIVTGNLGNAQADAAWLCLSVKLSLTTKQM